MTESDVSGLPSYWFVVPNWRLVCDVRSTSENISLLWEHFYKYLFPVLMSEILAFVAGKL